MRAIKLVAILAISLCTTIGKTQTYAIGDSVFLNYLRARYPQCLTGNILDANCAAVDTARYLSIQGGPYPNPQIQDLTGIEAFHNLRFLDCSGNLLTSFPNNLDFYLPYLQTLICNNNYLDNFWASLPQNLTYLDCSYNSFNYMPVLPSTLTYLNCGASRYQNQNYQPIHFQGTTLPAGLVTFMCYEDNLSSLPVLPATIRNLNADGNNLISITGLPDTMYNVLVDGNPNLYSLDSLKYIDTLSFYNTGIVCFQNYGHVVVSTPAITSVPLCNVNYITISDTGFVRWLNTHGYSGCMNGNQMDTSCVPNITWSGTSLDLSNYGIASLRGFEYVMKSASAANLVWLNISHNRLTVFPDQFGYHMANLHLNLSYNSIDSFALGNPYTATFYKIDLSHNNMHTFVYDTVQHYNLWFDSLELNDNQLTTFPRIIGNNPTHSYSVNWGYQMNIRHNLLTSFPHGNFRFLDCGANRITDFYEEYLPASAYKIFICDSNLITSMVLPTYYIYEDVWSMNMDNNPLASVEFNGSILLNFSCNNCALTHLSELPASMTSLSINNNPTLLCLPAIDNLDTLRFNNTGVTCAPDYGHLVYSSPAITSLPICNLTNSNGCNVVWSINGSVYNDSIVNCILEAGEATYPDVKVLLKDSLGNLLQQVFTDSRGGYYHFNIAGNQGKYIVQVDTTQSPVTVPCPASNRDTVVLTSASPVSSSQNFAIKCRPGTTDLAATGITAHVFHSARNTFVFFNAGGYSVITNSCAAGISGSVKVVFNGPVTYTGPASGALTPASVNGDTIIWNVGDFGSVNSNSFGSIFATNTNATIGSPVCFTLSVTSSVTDNNPANNILYQCFTTSNSNDPNEKDVSPLLGIDSLQQWLYYTIHFQNTGNAEATNIYIDDTLDHNLDVSTIQLLSHSHPVFAQVLNGNLTRFNFPNINLPDSTTDLAGSQGYVQFKIKPKNNLAIGTHILNTSFIYFDNNPAVITNTTLNIYGKPDTAILTATGTLDFCAGDSVILQSSTGRYDHYQWLKNGVAIADANDSVYVARVSGSYRVQISYLGTPAVSKAETVNAYPLPQPTLTADSSTTCANSLPMALHGSPNGGTYSGSGVSGSMFNPALGAAGIDTIRYAYMDGHGCSGAAVAIITLYPEPSATISIPRDTFLNCDPSVTLTATINGGTYSGSGVNGNTFDPTTATLGTDTLTYRYTDGNGCNGTAKTTVTIDICEGIAEMEGITLHIYPNPVKDELRIETDKDVAGYRFEVMDMSGKALISSQLQGATRNTIRVSQLASGSYIYVMKDKTGKPVYTNQVEVVR